MTARPGNVVRRIDPATNALGAPIAVGNNPTMGAEAADGSIVVPITGDGTLARIDPARNAVVETIRVGPRPIRSSALEARSGSRTSAEQRFGV